MEHGEYQLESLPIREYNQLQYEVVSRVAKQLGQSITDCLLVCSTYFRELVANNLTIAEELGRDRETVITRLTADLLEKYKEKHAPPN